MSSGRGSLTRSRPSCVLFGRFYSGQVFSPPPVTNFKLVTDRYVPWEQLSIIPPRPQGSFLPKPPTGWDPAQAFYQDIAVLLGWVLILRSGHKATWEGVDC
jgi:hypothetical protein